MKKKSTQKTAPTPDKRTKECPICEGPVIEEDQGDSVSVICYNCNVAPTVIGYYRKKRKTDSVKKGEIK